MASSSRVRMYMGCSFDGFIAERDHTVGFLDTPAPQGSPSMEESDALGFFDFMAQVGAMLMGRHTYDFVERANAWHYGETPVLVATHRELTPMVETVRAVSGEIGDLIAEAKEIAGDRDVYLDGGDLARQALDAGLVDELCITFVPIVKGGDGIRLFDGLGASIPFEFTDHRRHGHMVQVTLRPIRAEG